MIRVLIRKQPDRDFLTLYYVDPITRKERTRSAKTADRSTAERAARDWERELEQYHGVDGSGWQSFRDRFHDEHLAFKAQKTQDAYFTALAAFQKRVTVRSLSEITNGTMSTFAGSLLREKPPLAHATVKSYLSHLRAAFRWAEKVGMMRKAPAISVPQTGYRKHMRGRPLKSREFAAMLRACRQKYGSKAGPWRRFLKLLWLSGLRLSEAMDLSWDSGDLVVRIDAKPYPLIQIASEEQKGRTDTATPIAPDFARWLRLTPKKLRTGLVADVRTTTGTRFSAEKLSLRISDLGELSGVKVDDHHPTAHDLRRSFGTRWAKVVRPMTLQRMMRHKDFSTTLRFYIGLEVEDIGAELWREEKPE